MDNKKMGKARSFLLCILLFIILVLIGVSGFKVYDYFKAQKEAEKSVSILSDLAVTPVTIENTKPNQDVAEINEQEILCPISVDFDALHKENSDIIGWIHLPDTVISYPILQSDDNEYYVRRLTNGYWNIAGSIFLDCRNNALFTDPNSVIYGHNMTNNTMFGTLMDYSSQEYYDKHPYMFIITSEKTYRLELLSGFVTYATSDVYTFPQTDDNTSILLEKWLSVSDFVPKYSYTEGARLVTLSTCAEDYGNKRYVVIGALCETTTE